MKASLLLMAAAASLALASCSQDEPDKTSYSRAIDFRPAIGRATETTNANLSSINVTAFIGSSILFNQLDFVKGDEGYFSSTPEYYWPGDDSEVSFYAYSPETPGGTVTMTSSSKTMTDFSPAADIADQVDFITANATGKKSTNEDSGVQLAFDHRLAQIEVRAKSDNTAYTFEVTGVRIGQPVSIGSFNFESNQWTLGTNKAIYEEVYTTPRTLTSTLATMMGEGGNAMMIPQQLTAWNPTDDGANASKGAYLSVKLRITTTQTGTQVYPFPSNADCQWAAIPINTNWVAGKKYIYNLDLTHGAGYVDPNDPIPGTPVFGNAIEFTVDVADWAEASQDTPMTTN